MLLSPFPRVDRNERGEAERTERVAELKLGTKDVRGKPGGIGGSH